MVYFKKCLINYSTQSVMRVLSAKENHFQNLLGIKELVPSKLKLGYVALTPEDSINLSLFLRGKRDQPTCTTVEVSSCQLTVFENCNKTWSSSNFPCQQFLLLFPEFFFFLGLAPRKMLKTSRYHSLG